MKSKWYNNWQVEILVTDKKEIPEGFEPGRLKRNLIELLNRISKQDVFNYYVIENHNFPDTADYFNVTRGMLWSVLHHYNIHKDPKARAKNNTYRRTAEQIRAVAEKSSATQKQSWAARTGAEKTAWSELQKKSHASNEVRTNMSESQKRAAAAMSEDRKNEINQRRIATLKKLWQEDGAELLQQRNDTAKANRATRKQLCRSALEQRVYDALKVMYPDLQYDYKSEQYPYFVDFYIPSLDLYIELQGHPSHGRIPYNKDNKESLEEAYNMYGEWLKVYTQVDPEKYSYAVKNKLTYIRIYPYISKEQNYTINNNIYNSIVDIIFTALK